MKIVFISDTHGLHRRVEVPDGDLLIHAGDLTNVGEDWDLQDFNAWLGELPHKHKVIVAGNHDRGLERYPEEFEAFITNARYLRNSGCLIEGLAIWGSPYTPAFFPETWVFQLHTLEQKIKTWGRIPGNLDILITHGPPLGVLDLIEKEHVGDGELNATVIERKPRIHAFGHIHGGHGREEHNSTTYLNCSVVNEAYRVSNPAHVIEL